MTRTILHDTHIHLDLLLEKLGYGQNFRKYIFGQEYPEGVDLTFDSEGSAKISELLVNHQFVIQSTVSTSNFYLVWQLFKSNPKVFFLLGSHPEIVKNGFDLDLYLLEQAKLLELVDIKNLCGIGEVGLDYYITKSDQLIKLQKVLFISQIELAVKLDLPLVIHCRDAFDDLIEILKNYPAIWGKFLIHCFTGNKQNLQAILALNGFIALGGIVTYSKTTELIEAVKYCPMSNIMIETDAPFLVPLVNRENKVCLPEYIASTVSKIAEIKNLQSQDILDFSKHNAIQLFPLIEENFGNLQPYLREEKINE